MRKSTLRLQTGFTLIELLLVMVILGLMGGVFLATFPRMHVRSRDAQRKSDLTQYATALEQYANQHEGNYPEQTGSAVNAATTLCSGLGLTNCPVDPKDGTGSCTGVCRYFYQSNGDTGGPNIYEEGTRYTLRARVEELPGTPTCPAGVGVYWVICSGGKKGFVCANTSFSQGNCPL